MKILLLCKSLFRFELECGEMENRILKTQLNQVILLEQMENGTAIISNLSGNHTDQQFVTTKKVDQLE